MNNETAAAPVPENTPRKCANPECDRECGKLVCPQCKETNKPLSIASFCSQECFKTFWPIHKLTHELKPTVAAANEEKKA